MDLDAMAVAETEMGGGLVEDGGGVFEGSVGG